jgi:hypothetical protein
MRWRDDGADNDASSSGVVSDDEGLRRLLQIVVWQTLILPAGKARGRPANPVTGTRDGVSITRRPCLA